MSVWPLLHEMGTLYCKPKRRGEIKSVHWPVQWNLWWKGCSNASIKSFPDNVSISAVHVRVHVYQPGIPYVYICMCVGVPMCYCAPLLLCVGIQISLPLQSLDMGYLHSGMRNRFKFRDSFQALLFAVTFKSKSISAAPVVLLLG